MKTALLYIFLGKASLLWLSVFGYLTALVVFTLVRPKAGRQERDLPRIAVVVPTLDEEEFVLAKLADLKRTDYPRDRMKVVVVDGGSSDHTLELVERQIEQGEYIQLIRVEGPPDKARQINRALGQLTEEIVVLTDADSVLDPSCIREMVELLAKDTETAVVGAAVLPKSVLLEERIHWWFLNYLWWLEGEALSSAMVSGVACAVRREVVFPIALDGGADDISLALDAAARGYRVRLCRAAHATEVRTPQKASELVRFRRRRGTMYVAELLRTARYRNAPMSWRLARWMRVWHFCVTPKLVAALALLAVPLLGTSHWPWVLLVVAAFAAPASAALLASKTLARAARKRWRLGLAAGRLVALTLLSMLTLRNGVRGAGLTHRIANGRHPTA